MHFITDHYAHCNPLKDTRADIKIAAALGALLTSVLSTSPLIPFAVFLVTALLTTTRGGVPGRTYSKMFYGPMAFTLPAGAMIIFLGHESPILSFSVLGATVTAYSDGLREAILVLCRVLGASGSLFFLAFTTPMVEIFAALRGLGVPAPLVNLAMMIYRFVFVVMDEAQGMYLTQEARLGYSGFRRTVYSLGLLASNLFIRSWDRSDRLYTTMEARCFDGDLSALGGEV